MAKMPRKKRSTRDRINSDSKILLRLLIYEASGGTIPLPKGLEEYKPPAIPFPERRALLDTSARLMLTDLKVDPEEEVSGFDLLRGGYEGKRAGRENFDRGVSSGDDSTEESSSDSAS